VARELVDRALPRAHPPASVLRPVSSNSHVQEGGREEREREREREGVGVGGGGGRERDVHYLRTPSSSNSMASSVALEVCASASS
jgi:hypothetical protein